jgi:sterol O-acyltransferase
MLSSYRTTGYPLKTVLFDLISRDLMVFAASDLVMVCSTLLVVPFHRAIVNRWCPLLMGTLIKYAIELTLVGGAVWWIFVRDWPWSQSISFLMHSCVMAMKVHSYMSVNGEFEAISRRLVVLDKKRSGDRLSSTEDLASTLDNIPYGNINNGHPVIKKRSSSSAYNGAAIKGRRKSEVRFDASVYDSLADEIKDLQSELSKGSTNYPQNVSFMNYVNFLLVPTLVYELEYPRTNRIRPLYVAEKLVATLGVSWCIYFLIEHFVYPTLRDLPNESLLESCVKLMIPFMLGWIMLFFVIFEGVCNAFAELTRFADRNFYDDWWNSCSFDEFARKWNKPVHEFLLRHVYLEAIDSYKVSKTNATFITFLFSSVFHELIAAVVARKFSLFFFAAQMSQLPLIWAMRAVKHKPMLGNAMFWILLYAGMPIIAIAYSRDHFLAVNKS